MACHLAHKLPWASLHEIALRRPIDDPNRPAPRLQLTPEDKKKVGHFARCLVAAIDEFRASDRSSEDESAVYDPNTWPHQRPYGAGGWIGFYDSTPSGDLKRLMTAEIVQVLRNHAAKLFRCMYSGDNGGWRNVELLAITVELAVVHS